MSGIATKDWEALQDLAGRVGLPGERVTVLRRRLEGGKPRPGSPYTLLVGRPDTGIELLLDRWVGPGTSDALARANGRPLVIGPEPEQVRPPLGAWPALKSSRPPAGHVLALHAPGKLPPDVVAQVASLGPLDLVVLVMPLFQAMHQSEREAAEVLSALGATARAFLVWRPGEEPTAADLADVPAAVVNLLRARGFEGDRCLGAAVWFAGGTPPVSGVLGDPAEAFRVSPEAVAAGQGGMTRRALAQLLGDLSAQARTAHEKAPAHRPIPDEERDRLVRELAGFLADLGREVERTAASRPGYDVEDVRRYVLDAVRGWGAYQGIEGHWMKYVEALRKGMKEKLLAETQEAAACLDYRPAAAAGAAIAATGRVPGGAIDRLFTEGKRLAVGLGFGLAAAIAVAYTPLKEFVRSVAELVALVLGIILGYALGRRMYTTEVPPTPPAPEVAPQAAGLLGWVQFERRVTAWFATTLGSQPADPSEECVTLAQRLGIGEIRE